TAAREAAETAAPGTARCRAPQRGAGHRAESAAAEEKEAQDDEQKDDRHEDERREVVVRLGHRAGAAGRGGAGAAERDQHRRGAVDDAARELSLAEGRHDVALDDAAAQRVGQLALEAVADLDADGPLLRRDDEKRAGVLALFADPPGAAETVAEILDRIALQGIQRDDDDLLAGGALVRRELGDEAIALGRRQQPGLVDDAAG